MRFEGLEAFLRATVAISLPPNCLIKRLVKFGKVNFLTSTGWSGPRVMDGPKEVSHKNDPKIKFFAKSGKVVFRANSRR